VVYNAWFRLISFIKKRADHLFGPYDFVGTRASTLFWVGMARCAIRAAFSSGAILRLAGLTTQSFRRLTLRSATGKSQRDFPAKIKNIVQIRTPGRYGTFGMATRDRTRYHLLYAINL